MRMRRNVPEVRDGRFFQLLQCTRRQVHHVNRFVKLDAIEKFGIVEGSVAKLWESPYGRNYSNPFLSNTASVKIINARLTNAMTP